ncbi:PorV/PorQ family protein [candidate division KSB1 bacterium]|nr:PorV/PorQ family protein [candidate division KSB1 bacterium]
MTSIMKKAISLAAVSLLLASAAAAQNVTKTGTTAAKFLSIPVGSRALGMGGAYVSIANDASAMYWNPGGLAKLPTNELFVQHSEWLADINFDYLAMAVPFADGVAGINLTAMTMSEFEVLTEEFPNGTGETFAASSYALGVAYARNLTDRFGIGANVKYITEKIGNTTASSIAVDIGTMFTTPFAGIRLGASISNFGNKMQMTGDDLLVQSDIDPQFSGNNPNINSYLATEKFDLPLLLRIGISWDAFNTEQNRLTLAVDGGHPNDNSEYANAGFEYALFNETVFLRGGYKSIFLSDREEKFAFGGGFHYKFVRGFDVALNYAFEQFEHLDNVHKFSFSLRF